MKSQWKIRMVRFLQLMMVLLLGVGLAGCGSPPSPPTPLPQGEGSPPSPPTPLPRGEGSPPSPPTPLSQGEGLGVRVTFDNERCTYTGPKTIRPGMIEVDWQVREKAYSKFGLVIATLQEGKTYDDLKAWPSTDPPPWLTVISVAETPPDSRKQVNALISQGPVYFVCFYSPPDVKFDVAGPLEVETAQPPAGMLSTVTPLAAVPTADTLFSVVINYAERLNAGNLDGTMALWTEDAVFQVNGLPGGPETYTGKDKISEVFKENIASHFKMQVDLLKSGGKEHREGDTLTTSTVSWHDFTRQIGVAPVTATEEYVIKDGKIARETWTISPESLSRLKAALAELEAQAAPVTPTVTTPPVSVTTPITTSLAITLPTVTFVEHTCTYAGPQVVQAGKVTLALVNEDRKSDGYTLGVLTLEEGKTIDDLQAWKSSDLPPWATSFIFYSILPGERATYNVDVTQGPLFMVCAFGPEGSEKIMGSLGPIEVEK